MANIFLGLPAYNEQDSIGPLFSRIEKLSAQLFTPLTVMVYDDGCSDATKGEVLKWTSRLDIKYLDGVVNKGLGAGVSALTAEFAKIGKKDDVLVLMDCDDTHDPAQILQMIDVLEKHPETDVVIASRYRKGSTISGVPFNRIVLSIGAAMLYKSVHPIFHVRDYTCGYRAYRHSIVVHAMSKFSPLFLKESGFACMVELLLKLKKAGAKMREIPLQLAYDNKMSPSKMDVSGNVLRLSKKLFTWRVVGMK